MPDQQPVVEKHAPINDPELQSEKIKTGQGVYSHDQELPIKLRVKREGWIGRTISATTTETVWYRDAITYIEVPAGFTYDLASIPRVIWIIISPVDVALESLFHDLLYRKQEIRRRQADQTLLSMMHDRAVPCPIRWFVYLGVRLGGWHAWAKRAAENKAAKVVAAKLSRETNVPIEAPSEVAPDQRE